MLLRGYETSPGRRRAERNLNSPPLLRPLLSLLFLRPGYRQPTSGGEFLLGSSSRGCSPWLFPPPGWALDGAGHRGEPSPPQSSRAAAAVGAAPRLTSAGGGGGGAWCEGGRRRGRAGAGETAGRGGRWRVGGRCPSALWGGERAVDRRPRAEQAGEGSKAAGRVGRPPRPLRPTFLQSVVRR